MSTDNLELELVAAQKELELLRAELKDLRMRLSTVKLLVSKVDPACSEKLSRLLEACSGCYSETEGGADVVH